MRHERVVPTLVRRMVSKRQLMEAWVRGQRAGTIAVVKQDGVLMEARLAESWSAMRDAAAVDGVRLVPTSGFRTMEEQQRLWAEHQAGTRKTPVARPGFSNHQNGLALDIAVHDTTTSAEYRWLAARAVTFVFRNVGAGFRRPEWWHWEWAGSAAAGPTA